MRKQLLYFLSALTLTATLAAGTMMFAACGPTGQTEDLTDEPLENNVIADWSEGAADRVFASDGWTNASVFNCQWSANNLIYTDDGTMKLTITDNPDGSEEAGTEYFGGEARTYEYFGYGDYEVCMKPSAKAGTASTFFTCTGNYDTNPHTGQPNPWDEIDIEFLGQDTTEVQFNYYVNGVGGHEYMYDLGFDASKDFHEYGFRWTEDSITWFVDDKPVYKVELGSKNPAIPSTAGRILMNYWCGTSEAEGWMGAYSNPDDQGPEYKWISTTAQVDWGEVPVTEDVEEYEGDWSKIEAASVEFDKSDNGVGTDYTITAADDGKSAQITYTKAGNYDNVNFNASAAAADKNWLHFTLKNNSSTATNNVRVNIRNAENTATINSYGFGNGQQLTTQAGEGTTLSLSPNMTMEVEIKFNGIAGNVELMLDSMQANAIDKASDITISDIKFDVQGEVIIPETPEENNNGVTINGTKVVFGGNTAGQPYAINTDDDANTMNVTYSAAPGASYQNVSADIKAIAADKDTFTATVTNNGGESVALRVDIVATDKVNANTNVCNISATMDGESVYTDLEWGGSTFNIPAGATVEIEVKFDASYGPASLQFMLDTATYGDTATHAGDVTFADLAFSGEAAVDPDEPEDPDEPTDPDEPEEPDEPSATTITYVNASAITVQGSTAENNGPYVVTVNGTKNNINVVYGGVAANSYSNVELAGLDYLTQRNNVFIAEITNNGTETVNVRVNIQSTAAITANTNACNLSATQDGVAVRTDTEWGGSFFTVEAGKTIAIQIVYDNSKPQSTVQFMIDSHMGTEETHYGDITIGKIRLSVNGDQTEYPDAPVIVPDEPSDPSQVAVDLGTVTLQGNVSANGGPYTATVSGSSLNVTYSNLSGSCYNNVELGGLSATAQSNNVFTAKITNNGSETVNVRVNIQSTDQVSPNTNACNVSATQDGVAVRTDTEWGGSFFTVDAGKTITIRVVYDNTKTQNTIQFMIDSHMGTATTHTGDITISGMAFSVEA